MEAVLEDVFEKSPYPMWMFDVETLRLLHANEATARLYGYSKEELSKLSLMDLHAGKTTDELRRIIEEHRGDVRKSRIVLHRRKDGSHVQLRITIFRVDYQGRPATFAIGQDVTRRLRRAEAEKRRRRELERLAELNLRLTTNLNEEELLKAVVQAVTELIPQAEAAALWRYHGDGDEGLVCRAAWGAPLADLPGYVLSASAFDATAELRGIFGAVMEKGENVILEDAVALPGFGARMPELVAGSRALLGVPLVYKDRVEGFLVAYSFTQTGVFNASDARLVRSLAAQAAAAIHNVELFEEVRDMSRRLIEAQETERRRLGQELHDEVGGLLTALRLSLKMNPAEREDAKEELREAEALVDELTTHVRQLGLRLRPSMLDDLGLVPTLQWYCTRYTGLTKIRAAFRHDVPPGKRLPGEVATGAFRVVQEALTNVAKHAGVDEVEVLLFYKEAEQLEVHVIDHGRGFDPDRMEEARDSLGLTGMSERVKLLGGTIEIESSPGEGTRVTAIMPLTEA